MLTTQQRPTVAFQTAADPEYTPEVTDSIHDVDLDAWEQLCPGGTDLFMNPGLLGAVEASMTADASFWYVLFRDPESRPVAAAVLSTYIIDSTVMATGTAAKVAKIVGKIIPSFTRTKILFLGMPFSAGQSHVRFAPDADRKRVVRQLADLLEAKATETKSEIIVAKEFQESDLEWAAALEETGYRRADSLPMNYMPTEFDSFDDYLSRLRSKKRNELKGIQKKFGHANLTVEVCRGIQAAERFSDRAHRLYENVLFRSETRSEHLPKAFFVELARQLPEHVCFLYIHDEESLVAFGCCLESDELFAPIYAGIDYERNREFALYFNLLFLSVDRGLQRASRELWVGANADELKHLKLRTYQEPRYLFVRGGWWLARLILKPAFNLFFPPHEVQFPRERLTELRKAS